jgi:hypothetical protein
LEWTPAAVSKGYKVVCEKFQILTFVADGLITSPGGAPFGSAGFSINCPIVRRLKQRGLARCRIWVAAGLLG